MDFKEALFEAMRAYGIVNPGWKINIVSKEQERASSDWGTVIVDVIKPRCRKPCLTWEISIYIPGDIIFWEKSKGYKR